MGRVVASLNIFRTINVENTLDFHPTRANDEGGRRRPSPEAGPPRAARARQGGLGRGLTAEEHAVRSARSFSHEASRLESFMKGCDASAIDPSAWCAGIG